MVIIKTKRDACLYTISVLADADLRSKLSDLPSAADYVVNSFTDFKNLLDKDLSPSDLTRIVCDFVESVIKGKIQVTCEDLMILAEMIE